MAEKLSNIQNVALREVWPNEATDFTPWLAENISKLGAALGFDLEIRSREAPVGSYSLDLLAHDLGSDRPVIIENQLGTTDHTHLGQLLTYASGYDAHVAVWIAKEFRDEHRQALDWLNQRSDENTEFFGVVIEAWKIDDSRPAPHFKLVATPNEWRKQTVSSVRADGNVSELGERYREFFRKIIDVLREEHDFTNRRRAQTKSSSRFSSGYRHVSYAAMLDGDRRAKVYVRIGNRNKNWNKGLFNRLLEDKESIESELQESLKWERLEDLKVSRIEAVRQGSIDDDEETLEEIQDWMIERLLKFKQVFGPRLKDLDTP